ncbi:hypothetical protein I3843_11G072200 [Carya illinoinensis]|uniref:Uncharacterized protein n=2 Tax=Carya illinoinensis TaxID=32201 RepID=A0A8T1P4X9_CARIL|nr:hypothetical protein CIPAW_11G080900 [Carya illinoinensis]KAG7955457.1 hypothetical protein I3843_11G072200 [Carya illinoinensis]
MIVSPSSLPIFARLFILLSYTSLSHGSSFQQLLSRSSILTAPQSFSQNLIPTTRFLSPLE